MKLTGSQIVLEVLREQGVDTIFGYPGGTIAEYKRRPIPA
jgi:acetolactate synthase-1/2/3 large subunit